MKIFLRLAAHILPHWRWALLGIALSLAALLANMALLALSSWFIASMAIAGSVGAVMEYGLPSTAVRALALARAGSRYAERLVNHGTTFRILAELRSWFFRRIEPLAPARLASYRSGDLLSRIRADIDTLEDFYVRGVVPSVVALLAAACVAPFLARFDWRLAVIDLAALAAGGVLLPLGLKRLAQTPGRVRVSLAADLRAAVVEEAQGMAELIALGAVEAHERQFGETGKMLERSERTLASLQGLGEAGLISAGALAVWAAALVLVPLVGSGTLPRAHLAMLSVFILATFEGVMPLPAVIQKAGEMGAAARRLFEVVDAPPAASEPAEPVEIVRRPAGSSDAERAAVGVFIRGLRFRYAADQPWVFDGLTMEVPAGSRTGLVGPTGAGKSTLVSLLLRFWEYEGGSITVGDDAGRGQELRGFRGEDARRLFSVVPQLPHLFHASLRENLLLAAPDAGNDALLSALAAAQLGELLSRLPDGLDTIVGETGRQLSAGEAKRVAVARALLKSAPVYLLDEPTEGLDDATADVLLATVDRWARGSTLLIISHRERDLRLAGTVLQVRPPA